MRVAIIGAGIAGLACARALVGFGHEVVVFERSKAPGGRAATRRTDIGGFDHGAQYLTARAPAFIAQVEAWRRDGVVEPWAVDTRRLHANGDEAATRASRAGGAVRWVGVPGMSAIGAAMARDLDIRYASSIVKIEAGIAAAGWSLLRRDGEGDEFVVIPDPFDAVVAAVPGPSAVPLLSASPALVRSAAAASFEPCWALMIGFAAPFAVDPARVGEAAFVDGAPLAWIARDSSKPQRLPGERWTVHAAAAWSIAHLEDDRETLQATMLRAFHDVTGTNEEPVFVALHRWGHAKASSPLAERALWDAGLRLGACGDWCGGDRIEDAWLSGIALADVMGHAV